MSSGCQDSGVGQSYSPVLGPVHVHLGRGAQDGDGWDEAAGDGHGGGKDRHLLAGQEVLSSGGLTSTEEHHSDQSRDEEGGGQDQVLLPPELWQVNMVEAMIEVKIEIEVKVSFSDKSGKDISQHPNTLTTHMTY